MFGYVVANTEDLSPEEHERYRSVYCGLCRTLQKRHGTLGRLTLSYDMAFLVLLLHSLYEPELQQGEERCLVHPMSRHRFCFSVLSDYAADMNIALAYLNLLDNWKDDRSLPSLMLAWLLRPKYRRIKARYPRQSGAMEDCLKKLSSLEASGVPDPDGGAKLFGALMAELFVMEEDRWSGLLRSMALSLGGFIYLCDAVVDLPRDLKKGRYNPLFALKEAGRDDEYFKEILTIFIGNCTMDFEKLPLVEDLSILRNILYSGVWAKYDLEQARIAKQKGEKRQ